MTVWIRGDRESGPPQAGLEILPGCLTVCLSPGGPVHDNVGELSHQDRLRPSTAPHMPPRFAAEHLALTCLAHPLQEVELRFCHDATETGPDVLIPLAAHSILKIHPKGELSLGSIPQVVHERVQAGRAVRRLEQGGLSIAEAARALEVNPNVLHR